MTVQFVHLRVHSEFSLSDGMVRIKPLVNEVRTAGMPAVAVTDRSNLFALIKFYKAAQAAGIKPLVASDLQVRDDAGDLSALVLFAMNNAGYRNLSQLLSRAYIDGQADGPPAVKKAWISEHSEGLLALSAGRDGDVGRALLSGRLEQAGALARHWMSVFPDAYYLELQRTGRYQEEDYLHLAIDLASELDCPVVATNDVQFLDPEEFEAHEVRVCIHEGRTLDDPRRERRFTDQQFLRTPSEMAEVFEDIPEAMQNTVEIARRCNVELDLGSNYLPEFPIPDGTTTEEFFSSTSKIGLEARLSDLYDTSAPDFAETRKPYDERLDFELGVINGMGFPGYFLIVMEFIQWAKDQGIPVGPGRGSGAASLVAYSLKITDVDPLEYDLLFERFLNPKRLSMPDFDVDFCMDGRDRVIAHVTELYGRDAVSQIITFGTMAAKAVVRDVARVQGKPYGLADKLSKLIPFDPNMTLSKAMGEEPLLRDFVEGNDDAGEIMEMAYKVEGLTRNVGKHAGGVVIAPTTLTDFTPVYTDGPGGALLTQFDKDDVEQAGLVKFDFLGLRTLTIIDNAVKSVNERREGAGDAPIDIDSIALDDPAIYENLRAANTTAVFQLESRGMKDLMKKVAPGRFTDVVALVALFRPGPLMLAEDFINRKHGREAVDYLHPDLQPVLEDTYGVMLYQEQVMKIAQILAGYSLAEADFLRKAMGKKLPEEMDKQRDRFLKGAVDRGVDAEQAEYIFDLMAQFAGYGFNRPHSVCYALVAYQTAWLKHYFPADFMAAVLSADMQNTDKIVTNVDECREMKLGVLPPDVNCGDFRFVADDEGRVVYGLGSIKGLGEGPIDAIVAARSDGGAFPDLFDFCKRVGARRLNKRVLEALIGSGALDALVEDGVASGPDRVRAVLSANLNDALKTAEQTLKNEDSGHSDLFGNDMRLSDDDGTYGHLDNVRPLSFKERLAREKDALGVYLSGHPLDLYREEMRNFAKTRISALTISRDKQTVAGMIVAMRTMRSKKGNAMAFLTLDDRSGRIEVSVFGDLFDQHHEKLVKERVLVVRGATSADDFTGGLRMRADEVLDLAQAREVSAKRLTLDVIAAGLAPEFTADLAALLTPYKGVNGSGCPVSINYASELATAEILLGDEWKVTPEDELIQTLRERFGATHVNLRY